jgi:hypothetical protein
MLSNTSPVFAHFGTDEIKVWQHPSESTPEDRTVSAISIYFIKYSARMGLSFALVDFRFT